MSQPQDDTRTVEVGQKYDPALLKKVVEFVRMSPRLTALIHADADANASSTTED